MAKTAALSYSQPPQNTTFTLMQQNYFSNFLTCKFEQGGSYKQDSAEKRHEDMAGERGGGEVMLHQRNRKCTSNCYFFKCEFAKI